MSVIAGVHPVREALRAGRVLDRVVVAKGAGGAKLQEIIALCKQQGIQVRFEPREALERASHGAVHQGVIACGPEGRGKVSLDQSPRDNLWALAAAKGRRPDELTVVVLDRPRHEKLVEELRGAGARIHLITDGDVAPVVATCIPKSGIDMVYGVGGAPEGVLGAAAIHCMGGEFLGKLVFRNDGERERAVAMGHTDPDRIFRVDDLVRGDVIFVATGVTGGPLLKGVRRIGDRLHLQSLAIRSKTGTIRWVDTSVDAHRYQDH